MINKLKFITIILSFCTVLFHSGNLYANTLIEELKKPGTHLIIRHTLAPGTGDPDNFQVDDCATQRNLNDEGREQARRIGQFLKGHGITFHEVLSSQWCRCLDTAKRIDMGDVKEFELLNSTWTSSQHERDKRTNALGRFLRGQGNHKNLLLVTHYINILGFTGKTTGSGQGLVIRFDNDDLFVVGYFNTSDYVEGNYND
jgi:broad specificity phosphatase PhoE